MKRGTSLNVIALDYRKVRKSVNMEQREAYTYSGANHNVNDGDDAVRWRTGDVGKCRRTPKSRTHDNKFEQVTRRWHAFSKL